MSLERPRLTLWSWPASDCSARLRIALNLKNIPYQLKNVDLAKGERTSGSTNPGRTVPTLVISSSDGKEEITLTQSVAALEYLEEAFPETTPLLPPTSQAEARAHVRTLVHVITTDIHPLTTHRVADAITTMFPSDTSTDAGDLDGIREWELHWMRRGLSVYEQLVTNSAGKYSVGDSITMADVCLMPEVSTARKIGLDVKEFPTINGIFSRLNDVQAFKDDPHATTGFG